MSLIVYSVIIPLWSVIGGGYQESTALVEVIALTLRFIGGSDGTKNYI